MDRDFSVSPMPFLSRSCPYQLWSYRRIQAFLAFTWVLGWGRMQPYACIASSWLTETFPHYESPSFLVCVHEYVQGCLGLCIGGGRYGVSMWVWLQEHMCAHADAREMSLGRYLLLLVLLPWNRASQWPGSLLVSARLVASEHSGFTCLHSSVPGNRPVQWRTGMFPGYWGLTDPDVYRASSLAQ